MSSIAGVAIFTPIVGLTQTPLEFAIAVGLCGVAGGVTPSTVALLATQTPRHRVGSALGLVYAGRAAGQAIGPLAGGLLLTVTSFRSIMFALGGLYVSAFLLVRLGVVEVRAARARAGTSLRRALAELSPQTRRSLVALVVSALATQLAAAGAQQMIVLRLVAMSGRGAGPSAGVAFSALSGAAVLAAAGYSRFARHFGSGPPARLAWPSWPAAWSRPRWPGR